MRYDLFSLPAAVVCTAALLGGCATNVPPLVAPSNTSPLLVSALTSVSGNVILPTYADLATKSAIMLAAVQAFQNAQTDPNLQAACAAWRSARADYEQTYGFLIGPALYGIDANVNMWPTDVTGVNALAVSDTMFSQPFVAGLVPPLKGFHVIEYLLFGPNGNKTASAFTPQQVAYLVASSSDLSTQVNSLNAAWMPSGGNFVVNMLQAGSSNSVYPTGRDAVLDLVNTGVAQCGNVVNFMQTSAQPPNLAYDPSQYSQNGTADFANIITGVANVYLGGSQGGGAGISTLVAAKDPVLDDSVRSNITQTIAAIGGITPTFEAAIMGNPQQVQNAMNAASNLSALLGSVYALIQNNY